MEAIARVDRQVVAVILAGGQGRRMGGTDKAMLSLAGRPLFAHVAARIGPQVTQLAISANGDPLLFAPIPVLPDPPARRGEGPLAGILSALYWAEELGARSVLSVPVDTPFLPGDLVSRLSGAGHSIACSQGRAHPSVALWPVSLRPRIESLFAQGERRLRVAAEGAREIVFDAAHDPFTNLNTPEDLRAAEAILAKGVP
ncbi:molybdenum cofactor guanylyltransferase MobA [Thioclava pacifica]|uniref:Molybdenum cofactor guanylyltransferase n=1 Tax=Thioclava pacifica DSM 10166 TaxID=1353537 RepID=A0A074JUK0_9RHOB|nr:molybdenum cofactor guanylyltransferase MobA [Thioclava pacifica]KEO53032.1 hypothetical protein TP2_08815 [Thioclava pacifica DSM 10166]